MMRTGVVLVFLLTVVTLLTACNAAGAVVGTSDREVAATATATPQLSSCAMFSSCSDIPPASATLLEAGTGDIDLPEVDIDSLVQARVVRIISGDTLEVEVDDAEHTIQLAGIQVPEGCYASEATTQSWALLDLAGREVLLEGDGTSADQYVWLDYPEGIRLLNLELIRSGHARLTDDHVDSPYLDLLTEAAERAESSAKGHWGACSS